MSATSDAQPTVDAIASIQPRALPQNEMPSMVQESVTENQISVKTETVIERMEPVSEIQTSALQTGSTPTDSLVATELDKGNKGKEIIDTVSNQDSGKQRTPLKTLLGEAIAKSREESPVHHSQSASPVQQTETVTLDADNPETEAAMEEETEKEWNSPARYPVNIKAEKKRSKSRPWVPFLCCSSVNAR